MDSLTLLPIQRELWLKDGLSKTLLLKQKICVHLAYFIQQTGLHSVLPKNAYSMTSPYLWHDSPCQNGSLDTSPLQQAMRGLQFLSKHRCDRARYLLIFVIRIYWDRLSISCQETQQLFKRKHNKLKNYGNIKTALIFKLIQSPQPCPSRCRERSLRALSEERRPSLFLQASTPRFCLDFHECQKWSSPDCILNEETSWDPAHPKLTL